MYTDVKGHFDLVIKSYPNGVVSKYMDGLKEGDRIEVKGPLPKFKYVPNMKKRIGMVAGGSGITPMLQVCCSLYAYVHRTCIGALINTCCNTLRSCII